MSTNATSGKESNGIEKRTRKAAVESMSLDRYAGETGDYDVYAESGEVYRVNVVTGDCDCPSATYQDGACKHQRRVEMEIGQREVPDFDAETDVEMMINARADQQATESDDPTVATDGGVTVHSDQTPTQGRPEDCSCLPMMDSDDLGCFPCFQAGFETANPNASED